MPSLKGVPTRRWDERNYNSEMRKAYLIPFIDGLARRLAATPYLTTTGWIGVIHDYILQWERNQRTSFPIGKVEEWAAGVNTYHLRRFKADFARAFKVDISPLLNNAEIQPILRQSIRENVDLITTIPRRYHERIVEKYIREEAKSPLDLKTRERMFREQGKVSGWELRRITRDQSNKLTGQLTQKRQEMAGIDAYEWETSEDDRVRPTHADKNGRTFRWDERGGEGPADTGHPGHDIQCRCVAIPKVIAEELRQRVGR